MIVHVFSEKGRGFYDLDRLWRQAKELEIPADLPDSDFSKA
jgi:ribosomal silencing factor RsfS